MSAMAGIGLSPAFALDIDDEQLTDDQIEQLLKDAALRLRAPASNSRTLMESEPLVGSPKTSTNVSRSTSYVISS